MDLFHVLNRGVDKRTLFMDDSDRGRFVHGLYEFNDVNRAPDTYRTMWDLRSPTLSRKREPIVDIHAWCIMGNHYHLLLSEKTEGGLTKFLRKLNIGYSKYFNERHARSGALFQGRTKKIPIQHDAQFLHILNYIHLNPLDFLKGSEEWRRLRIQNPSDAAVHLQQYRWSSYLDYCGEKNFPSVITKDTFGSVFPNYKRTVLRYLEDIQISTDEEIALE